MLVHIFTRHARTCPKKDDPQWKRCRCVRWVHYSLGGQFVRESTGERSWEQATVYARGVEQKYGGEPSVEAPRSEGPVTVEYAVKQYIQDKRDQGLEFSTLRKRITWFQTELLAWCRKEKILWLVDLTLPKLRQWRSAWEMSPLSMQKKQEGVRQFFAFCITSGWLKENPAKGLSRIIVKQKPTDYFDDREMTKILKTASGKLHALVLLMRWSGLSIQDAVTLERERLNDQDQIFLYRAKTGTPVYITIPPHVAEELRELPLIPNPRYFFWTGNGKKSTVVVHWQLKFRKLFSNALLKHLDGTPKRCHPHMFRDTFAVNLLLKGVPMHDVSLLLGHSSVKTTERHYAPFVQARMERMDEQVRATWT